MTQSSSSSSAWTAVLLRHRVLLLSLLVLFLGLSSVRLTFTDGDEGRYVLLGLSIAEGQGRSDIQLPEPSPDYLTPPYYPLVVGAMISVVGQNLAVLKASSLVFFALAVWVLVRLFDRRYALSPLALAAAVLLGCGNVFVLGMNWMILAEMWFLLTLALAWWLAEDGGREGGPLRPLLSGVLAGASVLIRPSGLALLPAGFLHYATRKRWRDAAVFVGAGLAVNVPTMWKTMQLAGTPIAYLTHYRPEAGSIEGGQGGNAFLTIFENVTHLAPAYQFLYLPRHLFFRFFEEGGLLSLLRLELLSTPLSVCVGLLIVWGLVMRVKQRRFGIADWFFLGYLALISTYNQPDFAAKGEFFYQDRYLHPLLPLAGVYLVLAVDGARGLPSLLRRALPCVAAGYVLLTSLAVSAVRLKNEWTLRGQAPEDPRRHLAIPLPEHQGYGRFLEALQWTAAHTESDAIVISRKPRHTYIFSRRKSFRPTELNAGRSTWETWRHYAAQGPVYVLQDGYDPSTGYGRDGRATIDPLLEAYPDCFELRFETGAPVTRVWKLDCP